MITAEVTEDYPDDLVPLETFCGYSGITKKAIYNKIYARKWREGKEYFKDPDGKIWVSRSGYQAWIRQGVSPEVLNQEKKLYRSSSSSKVKLTTVTKPSIGIPPQLT